MVWYDQHNKKLCYAYNTTPTTSRTGVNSTGWTKGPDIFTGGGEYCQLAVDANGGIHIAAYTGLNNGANLKYAYPLVGTVSDGVDETEIFTGDWEVSFIPTSSTVPQSRINVGVFKNASGERVYFSTNKAKGGPRGTNNVGNGEGDCYGNGTDYPILGYEIYLSSKESWVETSQMK